MKKIKFLAMMIAAFSFTMGFTACGDDDDDTPDSNLWVGELGAPAYEADAVAYRITNSSKYGAIERQLHCDSGRSRAKQRTGCTPQHVQSHG